MIFFFLVKRCLCSDPWSFSPCVYQISKWEKLPTFLIIFTCLTRTILSCARKEDMSSDIKEKTNPHYFSYPVIFPATEQPVIHRINWPLTLLAKYVVTYREFTKLILTFIGHDCHADKRNAISFWRISSMHPL